MHALETFHANSKYICVAWASLKAFCNEHDVQVVLQSGCLFWYRRTYKHDGHRLAWQTNKKPQRTHLIADFNYSSHMQASISVNFHRKLPQNHLLLLRW